MPGRSPGPPGAGAPPPARPRLEPKSPALAAPPPWHRSPGVLWARRSGGGRHHCPQTRARPAPSTLPCARLPGRGRSLRRVLPPPQAAGGRALVGRRCREPGAHSPWQVSPGTAPALLGARTRGRTILRPVVKCSQVPHAGWALRAGCWAPGGPQPGGKRGRSRDAPGSPGPQRPLALAPRHPRSLPAHPPPPCAPALRGFTGPCSSSHGRRSHLRAPAWRRLLRPHRASPELPPRPSPAGAARVARQPAGRTAPLSALSPALGSPAALSPLGLGPCGPSGRADHLCASAGACCSRPPPPLGGSAGSSAGHRPPGHARRPRPLRPRCERGSPPRWRLAR